MERERREGGGGYKGVYEVREKQTAREKAEICVIHKQTSARGGRKKHKKVSSNLLYRLKVVENLGRKILALIKVLQLLHIRG